MKEFFGALLIAAVFCGVGSLAGYNGAQREAREKIEAARVEARAESLGRAKSRVDLKAGELFVVMATTEQENGQTAAIVKTSGNDLVFVDGLPSDLPVGARFVKTEGDIAVLK